MSNNSRSPRGFAAFSQSSVRHHRVEHAVTREIRSAVHDEAIDPELWGIRVLHVTLSPDGGHARVAYVVRNGAGVDEGAARRSSAPALVRATPFFRARLASQLDLKRVPKLSFTFVGVEPEGDP